MNHSHSASNSPALPGGGGGGGGAGVYPPMGHPALQQHQGTGRQDIASAPPMMYVQPGASMQYGAGVQQAPYPQGYSHMLQRPQTMMNPQHQQQVLQQQQQQQYLTQMRQTMLPGPRYQAALPPFQQPGFAQPLQDQAVYRQMIPPPNFPPSFYPQMPPRLPQRPDISITSARPRVFGGGQVTPNTQPWQMFSTPTNVNQLYQPVTRPHYQQPAGRHMVSTTVLQNVSMKPQEVANEVSQMNIPEAFQPRQTFVPRNTGTVYYGVNHKSDGEDKAQSVRPQTKKVLQIIDPNTGKNVLDTLDASQRQASDEALQIQSTFSKLVTQRIALGDKSSELNDFSEQHSTGTLPDGTGAPQESRKQTVEAGDQSNSAISSMPMVFPEVIEPDIYRNEDLFSVHDSVNYDRKKEVETMSEVDPTDSGVDLPLESSVEMCRAAKDIPELPEVTITVKQGMVDQEIMQEVYVEKDFEGVSVEAQVSCSDFQAGNSEGICKTESESSECFVRESKCEIDGSLIVDENENTEIENTETTETGITTMENEDPGSQDDDLESGSTEDAMTSESGDSRSRHPYEPGQWSPLNPDGKKVYSRDFLLRLQHIPESTQKPPGLPNLPEIIRTSMPTRDSLRASSFQNLAATNSSFDFMPRYTHERSSVGKAPISRSSFSKRAEPPVKIITIQRSENVQLHKTEQAWKPTTVGKDESSDPETSKTEDLYKKMRGILNKITPSTFDRLINQVTELPIDNETRLSGCIKILFEKAISEPKFVKAYSNMAYRLSSLNVQCDENPEKKVSFRKLLLNRCQEEFEKDKEDELDIERREKEIEETTTEERKRLLIEEKEQAIVKSRRRSLGNIRFIGELFKLKMLTEAIMHDCVKKLLNADDEDSLELLCNLLTTIGKELDTEKLRKLMDSYFAKLSSKKELPPRIRFMVQDLFELRENKWVPRRVENIPKTIDQIHREAHEEKELAKQQMLVRPPPKPRQERRLAGPTSSLEKGSDDGWSTAVGSGSKIRIDASKILKIAKSMKDDVTLAPQFAPSWQKGSGGLGSRGSSQEGEKPLVPANRYAALENIGYSGSDASERSGEILSAGRISSPIVNRHLPASLDDGRKPLCISQDDSKNVSHDLRETQSCQNQLQGTASTSSLAIIYRREETQRQEQSVAELPREEIERKTVILLEEYFGIEDLKEAFTCVEELRSPNSLSVFVSFAINYVLEKKQHVMSLTGALLHELLIQGVLSHEKFEKGIKEVLEEAENLAVDIPRFWEYLGDILASTLQADHQLWNLLKISCKELDSCGKSEILFRKTMNAISVNLGSNKTCDAMRKSGVRWSSYVHDGLFSYTRQHSLAHLDPVREELIALLKQHSDNQPIFDWIQRNVSELEAESREFIRALITAVCFSALTVSNDATPNNVIYVVNEDRIGQRMSLLQRFLDRRLDREIQALFALQALMHSLEHPPNLLNTIFEILFEKEVITLDAFNDWKKREDPVEQTGRGVALQSVQAFFHWVNEITEEEAGS